MLGTGTPERISQLCVPKVVGHLNEMGLDELKRPFNIVLDALQSPTTILWPSSSFIILMIVRPISC